MIHFTCFQLTVFDVQQSPAKYGLYPIFYEVHDADERSHIFYTNISIGFNIQEMSVANSFLAFSLDFAGFFTGTFFAGVFFAGARLLRLYAFLSGSTRAAFNMYTRCGRLARCL
jgi:hypothetical protein